MKFYIVRVGKKYFCGFGKIKSGDSGVIVSDLQRRARRHTSKELATWAAEFANILMGKNSARVVRLKKNS